MLWKKNTRPVNEYNKIILKNHASLQNQYYWFCIKYLVAPQNGVQQKQVESRESFTEGVEQSQTGSCHKGGVTVRRGHVTKGVLQSDWVMSQRGCYSQTGSCHKGGVKVRRGHVTKGVLKSDGVMSQRGCYSQTGSCHKGGVTVRRGHVTKGVLQSDGVMSQRGC